MEGSLQMSEPKTHVLRTYDRKEYSLTRDDKIEVDRAMEAGKVFVRFGELDETGVPKHNIAIRNISSLEPIPYSPGEPIKNALPAPRKDYKMGKGYQSFLKARDELIRKRSMRNENQD